MADHVCAGCGRPVAESAELWLAAPLGLTCVRAHPECRDRAAESLDARITQPPKSKAKVAGRG
jgi:hypothetical protein